MVRHDLKCTACGQREDDVFCRKSGGEVLIPSCPQCGGDRDWVPSQMTTNSTQWREPPADVAEHMKPGRGGFVRKTSTERLQDHMEARRKGDAGNQAEFADVMPLTNTES